MHFLNRKLKISWFRRSPKWSPDLLQLRSRNVSGCTWGTLGPSLGIRTWFRVPSWAPRTLLGVKFGVENWFCWHPTVNFRRKNLAGGHFLLKFNIGVRPTLLPSDRCTVFRLSMSPVRRVARGVSSHMVNEFLFFSGSAAVGAALSNPPTPGSGVRGGEKERV